MVIWQRNRNLLEAFGQLDWLIELARPSASTEFARFEAAVLAATGKSFDEWAMGRIEAGASIRDMAVMVDGTYPATLWRWIRRRLPRAELAAAKLKAPLNPSDVAAVSRLFDGGKSVTEIVAATGIPRNTVARIRKRWVERREQRRERERNDLVIAQRALICRPWTSTGLKHRASA